MQKARRHIIQELRPLVGVRFQELFHSPARGTFHLSLTVLVHYRSLTGVFSLAGWARRIHTGLLVSPRYSGVRYASGCFDVRGCHALWRFFPVASTHGLSCDGVVLQPRRCRDNVGLGCSPFARHYWGNHSLFSFPAGTKMFQFPALASRIGGIIPLQDIGLSHSEISDQRSFAPPRGLSQLITSFIASESQGIHHAPFFTFACTVPLQLLGRDIYFFSMFVYIPFILRFVCTNMSKIVSPL